MGKCMSCGGTPPAKPDPNRAHATKWSVRWAHGVLTPFKSEAAARAFMERNADRSLTLLSPKPPEPDDDEGDGIEPPPEPSPLDPGLRGP